MTFDFGYWQVVNRAGAVGLNVCEYNTSTAQFIPMTVLVSQDGLAFTDIKASQVAVVGIPGDEAMAAPTSRAPTTWGPRPGCATCACRGCRT